MNQPSSIVTARLTLRGPELADAAAIQRLASDREIAERTLLPHPYEDGMAAAWIERCRRAHARGEAATFTIVHVRNDEPIGVIGLAVESGGKRARFGLWLGRDHWGRGYGTEAAAAVVAFGFETLGLERIWAPRFRANRASARVLEKVGFAHEGSRRQFVVERARTEIVESHGMLRWEYFTRTAQCGTEGREAWETS